MGKVGAFAGTFMAIGFAGLAQAIPTNTAITGSLSKSENTCVSPITLFTSSPPESCSYSGGEDVFVSVGLGQFKSWLGPLDSGGFYATGTGPDPLTTGGSVPADGKVNLPITGTVTIEDNNTPGNGGDDSISGTLVIGAGERAVSTSDGNALESFSSVTHTIPVRVVDSAALNAQGGYDYVIGSDGFPLLLHSAYGDDYPSESASIASGSTIPPDFNAWDQANGGNIPVVNMPFPAGPPPLSQGPYTVEVVTYAPANSTFGPGPNIGVATTAVIAGYLCVAGDGAGPIDDCSTDPDLGSPGTWGMAGAEFDNLIIKLSTDANNKVVSADAFYALEYKIPSLFPQGPGVEKPGSYIGGTLNFTGNAEAADDSATTPQDTAVDIDILANDFNFTDPVTVSLPGLGASANGGTVAINGSNPGPQSGIDVTYTPPAGYTGQDTFDYTVDEGGGADSATVTINVTGGGGGNIFPIAPNAGVNTGEGQTIDIVVNVLPGVSLGNTPVTISVVSGPSSGTATVFGQTITYTPTGFPPSDSFDYTIADADGDSDTGTISVAIGPPLKPTAVNDDVLMQQDGSASIDVTVNDIPGSGDIENHTVTITAEPVSGTATIEADNTVTYVPDTGVSGTQTFAYTLTDENADISAAAIVTITVQKIPIDARLPSDNSSATGPFSLLFLAAIGWLRRRTLMIRPTSGTLCGGMSVTET
jgi:hypothetical protein